MGDLSAWADIWFTNAGQGDTRLTLVGLADPVYEGTKESCCSGPTSFDIRSDWARSAFICTQKLHDMTRQLTPGRTPARVARSGSQCTAPFAPNRGLEGEATHRSEAAGTASASSLESSESERDQMSLDRGRSASSTMLLWG